MLGYSEQQLAAALEEMPEPRGRRLHGTSGVLAQPLDSEPEASREPNGCFKMVDTCSAEFRAATPYYYSTHERPLLRVEGGRVVERVQDELCVGAQPHVIVLGGGPNRIGQGIEFDYCCVHAAMEVKRLGFRTVMINSNPETVSTDYDTSDLLFFEPLTLEDVMRVIRGIAVRGKISRGYPAIWWADRPRSGRRSVACRSAHHRDVQ